MVFDISIGTRTHELISSNDHELIEGVGGQTRDGNDVVVDRLFRPPARSFLTVMDDVPAVRMYTQLSTRNNGCQKTNTFYAK